MGDKLCQHIKLVDKKTAEDSILHSANTCGYGHSPTVSGRLCLVCPASVFCNQIVQSNSCIQKHKQQSGHTLGLVLSSGFVVCSECTNDFEDMVTCYKGDDQAQFKKCKAFYSFVKRIWTQRRYLLTAVSQRDKDSSFGLVNLGNTCFFNSIVQSICTDLYAEKVKTMDFDNKIKFRPFSKDVEYYYDEILDKDEGEWIVVQKKKPSKVSLHKPVSDCSINKQWKKLLVTAFGCQTFHPGNLFDSVARIYPPFREYKQQDAQQFMRIFFDALREGELRCLDINIDRYKKIQQIVGPRKLTILDHYYGCYLASRVICLPCEQTTWTLDLALDFSMQLNTESKEFDVSQDGVIPKRQLKYHEDLQYPESGLVPSILKSFFSFESLSTYKCPKCLLSNSIRKFYIVDPPQTVTLVLKRFRNDMSKDNTFVPFEQTIDLSPVILTPTSGPANQLLYRLSSIIVHIGGNGTYGHYICYRRQDDHWLIFSDESVKVVQWENVKVVQAYILLYSRL